MTWLEFITRFQPTDDVHCVNSVLCWVLFNQKLNDFPPRQNLSIALELIYFKDCSHSAKQMYDSPNAMSFSNTIEVGLLPCV